MTQAQASVMVHCAYDYLANCSRFVPSSSAGRKCMADVGIKLSPRCIQALVDEKYITKQQVIDQAAKAGIVVVDTGKGLAIDPDAKVGDKGKADIPLPVKKPEPPKEVVETKPPTSSVKVTNATTSKKTNVVIKSATSKIREAVARSKSHASKPTAKKTKTASKRTNVASSRKKPAAKARVAKAPAKSKKKLVTFYDAKPSKTSSGRGGVQSTQTFIRHTRRMMGGGNFESFDANFGRTDFP